MKSYEISQKQQIRDETIASVHRRFPGEHQPVNASAQVDSMGLALFVGPPTVKLANARENAEPTFVPRVVTIRTIHRDAEKW